MALMLAGVAIDVRSVFLSHKTPENSPFRLMDPLNEDAEIQEELAEPFNPRLAWRYFRRRAIIHHYWQIPETEFNEMWRKFDELKACMEIKQDGVVH
jgi:hypothetical protein